MADSRVSDLPAAASLTGAELLPVVQAGNSRRATAAQIAALAVGSGGGSATPLSDAAPTPNGTAAPGIAATAARGDHVHPTDTSRASQTALNSVKATADNALPRGGGTMTGSLVLAGDATAALEATTKRQLDSRIAEFNGNMSNLDARITSVTSTANGAVAKSGGTMTGALILPGNATAALQAVPKQQLDAALATIGGILVGSALPGSGQGKNGDFYFQSGTGLIFGPKTNGAWPGTGIPFAAPVSGGSSGGSSGGGGGGGTPSAYRLKKGVWTVNDSSKPAAHERWLGTATNPAPVDYICSTTGMSNWSDFQTAVNWMIDTLWANVGRRIHWSTPPFPTNIGNGAMAACAAGDYWNYHRSVATSLLRYGNKYPNEKIEIRLQWEGNGNWFAWSIGEYGSTPTIARDAFRRQVDAYRSVSADRFRFEWCPNFATGSSAKTAVETWYPGNDWVDLIGYDYYYKPEYEGNDPQTAWNMVKTASVGFDWATDFGAARNKPVSLSEWGVKRDGDSVMLNNIANYIRDKKWESAAYWDRDDSYPGMLSDNGMPTLGAAYRAQFGAGR